MRKFIDTVTDGPKILEEDFKDLGKKAAAGALAGALSFGIPSRAAEEPLMFSDADTAPHVADQSLPLGLDSNPVGIEPADAPELLNDDDLEEGVKDTMKKAGLGFLAGLAAAGAAGKAGERHDYDPVPVTAQNTTPTMHYDGFGGSGAVNSAKARVKKRQDAEGIKEAYRTFMAESSFTAETALDMEAPLEDDMVEDDGEEDGDITENFKYAGAALVFAGLASAAGIHNTNKAAELRAAELSMTSDADRLIAAHNSQNANVFYQDADGSMTPFNDGGERLRKSSAAPPPVKVFIQQARYIDELPEEVQEDWAYLTMTIWGEARGEGKEGMIDVANVIRNRLNEGRWGNRYKDVVTSDQQFSCWNEGDSNTQQMYQMFALDTKLVQSYGTPEYDSLVAEYGNDPNFKAWVTAKAIAWKAISDRLRDTTGGANHYHTGAVDKKWDDNMAITKQSGDHIFFKGT